jgi:CheY-like chemotaxis protein
LDDSVMGMQPTEPTQSVKGPDTGRRVLIVEDDTVARLGLVQLLEPRGFSTAVARTLDEGLAKLAWRPDFVVLDLSLSDGRGTVLLRRIRADRLPIRVAVTTGTADECLVAAAQVLRPDRLFRKPYSTVDLLDWLEWADGDDVGARPAPMPPPVDRPPARPYDVSP